MQHQINSVQEEMNRRMLQVESHAADLAHPHTQTRMLDEVTRQLILHESLGAHQGIDSRVSRLEGTAETHKALMVSEVLRLQTQIDELAVLQLELLRLTQPSK
jgi:hypothetical protein